MPEGESLHKGLTQLSLSPKLVVMTKLPASEDLLFTADVAALKKVDVRTVHRWVRTGKLKPAVTPRGATRALIFHRADVEALLPQDVAS